MIIVKVKWINWKRRSKDIGARSLLCLDHDGEERGLRSNIMDKDNEDMKLWLFDLAHGNISNYKESVKGFVKYYVLHGLTMQNVADDIHFRTQYGDDVARIAINQLTAALNQFLEEC